MICAQRLVSPYPTHFPLRAGEKNGLTLPFILLRALRGLPHLPHLPYLPASKAKPRILRPRHTKCLPGHRFNKRFLPEAVHKALVARVALAGLLAPVHKELALVIKAIATFHTRTPGMLLLLCLARCTIFNLGVVEPQCQCHIRRRRCHFVFVFVSMGSPAYQYILEKSISIFIITHFPVSHSFPVTWSAAPEKKMDLPCHCSS